MIQQGGLGGTAPPPSLVQSVHISRDYHGNGTTAREGAWDCVKVVTPIQNSHGNVLINPRATPSGVLTHSLVHSVYTPGRHRITITYNIMYLMCSPSLSVL